MSLPIRVLVGKILFSITRLLPCSDNMVFGAVSKLLRTKTGGMILRECGRNVNIERGSYFTQNCSLGNNSGIGINAYITGTVDIGDDVMMGPECKIYTTNHCIDKIDIPMNRQGITKEAPVVIGDDVWIGVRVTILPGVQIGSHSVVCAGAVVTENVPEYAIVGGVPATLIKMRNC